MKLNNFFQQFLNQQVLLQVEDVGWNLSGILKEIKDDTDGHARLLVLSDHNLEKFQDPMYIEVDHISLFGLKKEE